MTDGHSHAGGDGLAERLSRFAQRLSGKGRAEDESPEGPPPRESGAIRSSREVERRRQLYGDIGEFLFAHDLDLTPLNFGLAHDYLTGNDLSVEKAVKAVLYEKGRLTNGLVENIVSEARHGEITAEALGDMLDKVEENLSALARLVSRSHSHARDYGDALQEQVKDLADTQDVEPVLTRLVTLTRNMVENSRKVENQMRDSQKQTRLLQKNLESARRAAEQDHLTGLPNRRAFEAKLAEMVKRAKEKGEAISIAFCDIDHFKSINDTHGHDVGDRVLKFVGGLLAKISNDSCHVARHGGEEFVMLFAGMSASEACAIVDEAREDLSHRNLVNRTNGERMEQVTFSAGVANLMSYEDPRAALKAADRALYLAKEHGRNRVYIAAEQS